MKRPLDACLAALALVCLSPVMGATALLVRAKLGSPVVFSQERPGRIDPETGEERIFKLHKFRTMTDARDAEGNLLPDDERLTPFGRALRSTSLDELPELWNILKGDMAVVGPRPLAKEYLPYYTETEARRHEVRPGLTGLAQVMGRNSVDWARRFGYDVDYVDRVSFLGDMRIVAKTVSVVVSREGIGQGEARPTSFHEVRQREIELRRQREESQGAARRDEVAGR